MNRRILAGLAAAPAARRPSTYLPSHVARRLPAATALNVRAHPTVRVPGRNDGDPRPPRDLIRQIDLLRDPDALVKRTAARARAAAEASARAAAERESARTRTPVCPTCHLHLPLASTVCDTCGEADGWHQHYTGPSYDIVELD